MGERTASRWRMAGAVVLVLLVVGVGVAGNAVADLLTTPAVADPAASTWGLRSDAGNVRLVELVERDGDTVVADVRHGLDSGALEQVEDDGTFRVPTLVIVAGQDTNEPAGPAQDLAELVDEVRLVRVEDAPHIRAWNTDPARYEQVLTEFLATLP